MTAQMPDRLPLPMPSGDAGALADLARDVGFAGRCLAAVDARLRGSATEGPGWLGEDAAAAAAQVGAVLTLVRAAADAALSAARRLDQHAERLLEIRRQISALNEEQHEQFRRAWHRWYGLPDLPAQIMISGPDVRAIVADVEAGEADRSRRHHALLEEVAGDAAATARVLADSCAVVGGRGGSGDADRVYSYLAAQLPGWGDRELARRGRALAEGLTDGTPSQKADAATAGLSFAGSTPFADALLAALGVTGVTYVLRDLGGGMFVDDGPVALILALAFGAAVAGGGTEDPVARVLDADYVRAQDDFGVAGTVATGLAMLLAASASTPSGGVGTRTVAGWGRQFLLWEHEHRERIGTRSAGRAPEVGDPTGLAISILAQRAEPGVSAALLDAPGVWDAALRRLYDDGGAALGQVVAQAGLVPGEVGDRVLRMGLATAGAGLSGEDPAAWTVERATLAGVAPGLGDAVSAHVAVAVEALEAGAGGHPRRSQLDVLAGLGYVTLDRVAAATVRQALSAWAQVRPDALADAGPRAASPAGAVFGAYVAVQEFAQRTNHAMDALEDRAEAEAKQWLWQRTFHLLGEVPGPLGIGLGLLEGYGSIAFDTDGTWKNPVDRGLVFGRADAAALARVALAPQDASGTSGVHRASVAFDRTAAVLGERRAPMSPETDLWAPVADLGIDVRGERVEHERARNVFAFQLPH